MAASELTASLLVAMPQLLDPNFKRTVVLLIHHDEESTFGIVLNRPAELSVKDLCESLDFSWRGDADQSVQWGGPVEVNTGWLLFGADPAVLGDESVTELESGLCFAGSLDVLRTLAEGPDSELRVFLGYAGWGPGQLESELAQGAWLIAPLDQKVIFNVRSENMWSYVVRSMGIDPATLSPTAGVH